MAEYHGTFDDELANGAMAIVMHVTTTDTRLFDADDHIGRRGRKCWYQAIFKANVQNTAEDERGVLVKVTLAGVSQLITGEEDGISR